MNQYMIAYVESKTPHSPEAGQAGKEKWGAWLQSLGDAVINRGTPLMQARTVTPQGVKEGGSLNGFTVVQAESLEAALTMAQSCPYLEMGNLEVYQMVKM